MVDWDVKGGSQRPFGTDPRVLYVSFEQKSASSSDAVGVHKGPAAGFNINIPWSKRGMGNSEYFAALTNIILPIAYEYAPQMTIISAEVNTGGNPMNLTIMSGLTK